MAVPFMFVCLTLAAVSGKILEGKILPGSFYHYNHALKPDSNTAWNFISPLNGGEVSIDTSGPDLINGDNEDYEDYEDVNDYEDNNYEWQFQPLVNSNKDYLYDYVGDNWLSGEDSPYYYHSEGKGNNELEDYKKADKEELLSKLRKKNPRLKSYTRKRKRESGLKKKFNSLFEARPARTTSEFVSNRMKRSVKLHTPNFLGNAENVHPAIDQQFIPILRKRDIQMKTAGSAGHARHFQKSRRNVKRRRRQVKAHQLEYFTDNDGDSQFHAPGKSEGTEWDLVPLEALKDDNEEELGIQYDKKVNDASLLISE